LKHAPRIIRDNKELFQNYRDLTAGDIICGRIRLKPGEDHLLLDLSVRGIAAIPSLISQMCSRSKVFQTRLFGHRMIPDTMVIYTFHDLLNTTGLYGRRGYEEVIVKQEGKNGGLGIFRFKSIEDVYTQSALGVIPYPYVIQPFIPDCQDLRVIILDSYMEVYERRNPDNFRNNLHCGGTPVPSTIDDDQLALCREIMRRGEFPYAHLDLMVADDGSTYFTEVNLRGGLRGAAISSEQYQKRIADIHQRLCSKLENQ
jgi:ribosomal protein S6--L-glutamate ligase